MGQQEEEVALGALVWGQINYDAKRHCFTSPNCVRSALPLEHQPLPNKVISWLFEKNLHDLATVKHFMGKTPTVVLMKEFWHEETKSLVLDVQYDTFGKWRYTRPKSGIGLGYEEKISEDGSGEIDPPPIGNNLQENVRQTLINMKRSIKYNEKLKTYASADIRKLDTLPNKVVEFLRWKPTITMHVVKSAKREDSTCYRGPDIEHEIISQPVGVGFVEWTDRVKYLQDREVDYSVRRRMGSLLIMERDLKSYNEETGKYHEDEMIWSEEKKGWTSEWLKNKGYVIPKPVWELIRKKLQYVMKEIEHVDAFRRYQALVPTASEPSSLRYHVVGDSSRVAGKMNQVIPAPTINTGPIISPSPENGEQRDRSEVICDFSKYRFRATTISHEAFVHRTFAPGFNGDRLYSSASQDRLAWLGKPLLRILFGLKYYHILSAQDGGMRSASSGRNPEPPQHDHQPRSVYDDTRYRLGIRRLDTVSVFTHIAANLGLGNQSEKTLLASEEIRRSCRFFNILIGLLAKHEDPNQRYWCMREACREYNPNPLVDTLAAITSAVLLDTDWSQLVKWFDNIAGDDKQGKPEPVFHFFLSKTEHDPNQDAEMNAKRLWETCLRRFSDSARDADAGHELGIRVVEKQGVGFRAECQVFVIKKSADKKKDDGLDDDAKTDDGLGDNDGDAEERVLVLARREARNIEIATELCWAMVSHEDILANAIQRMQGEDDEAFTLGREPDEETKRKYEDMNWTKKARKRMREGEDEMAIMELKAAGADSECSSEEESVRPVDASAEPEQHRYYCPDCMVYLNGKNQWMDHKVGKKHLRCTRFKREGEHLLEDSASGGDESVADITTDLFGGNEMAMLNELVQRHKIPSKLLQWEVVPRRTTAEEEAERSLAQLYKATVTLDARDVAWGRSHFKNIITVTGEWMPSKKKAKRDASVKAHTMLSDMFKKIEESQGKNPGAAAKKISPQKAAATASTTKKQERVATWQEQQKGKGKGKNDNDQWRNYNSSAPGYHGNSQSSMYQQHQSTGSSMLPHGQPPPPVRPGAPPPPPPRAQSLNTSFPIPPPSHSFRDFGNIPLPPRSVTDR